MKKSLLAGFVLACAVAMLVACGGGGGDTPEANVDKYSGRSLDGVKIQLCENGCGSDYGIASVATTRDFGFDLSIGMAGGYGAMGDLFTFGGGGTASSVGAQGYVDPVPVNMASGPVYTGSVTFPATTNLPASATQVFVDPVTNQVQQNIYTVDGQLRSVITTPLSSYSNTNPGHYVIPIRRYKFQGWGGDN